MIKAAELTRIPTVEIIEMILIILCFFLENKYLQAIKRAVLMELIFTIRFSKDFQYFQYNPENHRYRILKKGQFSTDFSPFAPF